MPTLTPLTKTVKLPNSTSPTYIRIQSGYKCTPKGSALTPYVLTVSAVTNDSGTSRLNTTEAGALPYVQGLIDSPPNRVKAMQSRAFEDFLEGVNQHKADWLANLFEGKQSWQMITARALQVRDFAVAVRRRDFELAKRVLLNATAATPLSRHYARSQFNHKLPLAGRASDLWLEGWWGWAPVIGDMQASMAFLERASFSHRAEGRASVGVSESYSRRTSSSDWIQTRSGGSVFTKISADITVSNPNVYAFSQLGLLNPLGSLWEAAPWSWLADWAANVGTVIQSWSWDYGLSVTNPMTTISAKANHSYTSQYNMTSVAYANWARYSRRSTSVLLPKLAFRTPDLSIPTRAASAVALLTKELINQRFKR